MGDRGEDFEVAHCPYLFPRRRLAFCPWPSLEGGQQWDETAGESVLDLIPTAAKREGVAVNMFWMEGWGGEGGGGVGGVLSRALFRSALLHLLGKGLMADTPVLWCGREGG